MVGGQVNPITSIIMDKNNNNNNNNNNTQENQGMGLNLPQFAHFESKGVVYI